MTKEELIFDFKNNNPIVKIMDNATKDIAVELFKTAIEVTQEQTGNQELEKELVYKNYIKLVAITDPNNKLNPFSLEEAKNNQQ